MRAGPRFTGPPVLVLRSQPAEVTINVGWQKRVRSHFSDSARTTEPAVPASMRSPFFGRVAVPSEAHRAKDGGEGGIRTLGTLASTHDFQSCTLDHSVTSPETQSARWRTHRLRGWGAK